MLVSALDYVEKVMRKYKFAASLQINGCIVLQILVNEELCQNSVICSKIVNLVCEAVSK